MRALTTRLPTSAHPSGTDPKSLARVTYPGTSTNSVTANAVSQGSVAALVLASAAVVALAIAVTAPLATTVIGLIGFGLLHNVLELRYVLGRYGWVLGGRVGGLLLVLITGVVGTRLLAGYLGSWGRAGEIVLGYAVLAAGAWLGLTTSSSSRTCTTSSRWSSSGPGRSA